MFLWPFGELFWKSFCRSSFPLSSSFALFFYDLMTNYNVFRFLELFVYIYYRFLICSYREVSFLIKGHDAAKSLQSCLTLCSLTRLPRLWNSPGKNTVVGCHFLLQCIKVKKVKLLSHV